MQRWLLALLLLGGVSLHVCVAEEGAPAADPPKKAERFDPIQQKIADDWDRLQGTWVRQQTVAGGQHLRLVKTIKEHGEKQHRETLQAYDAAGKLLREQTADLKIEIRGNLHVLLWSNAKATAGIGQGTAIPDGTAVITFKEGRFISVCGLADDETWAVYAEEWTRDNEGE
jgi:hypothetical protein